MPKFRVKVLTSGYFLVEIEAEDGAEAVRRVSSYALSAWGPDELPYTPEMIDYQEAAVVDPINEGHR